MSDGVTTLQTKIPWLFSRTVDLAAFGGSAAIAMLLVGVGWGLGLLEGESPEWTWITAVLLVDVAHVYATGFRVYFVPEELRRRPWLYALAPLLSYLIGVCLYSESEVWFWRCLAYVAVFHFVRQQAGWVALYRAKGKESAGGWIDFSAIYAATIWPMLWWHDHLPRGFWWFREGDFLTGANFMSSVLQPIYWMLMMVYSAKSIWKGLKHGIWNPGKDLVVITTAVCWYVGIVLLNSDYAFTVTNVLIHGVPYIVLVYWFRYRAVAKPLAEGASIYGWWKYLGVLWMLAYGEEFLWDRGVWDERPWLFGSISISDWLLSEERGRMFFVPLLAVPQLTHYILDGFIWKRGANPEVQEFAAES